MKISKLVALFMFVVASASAQKKPNIVYIICDDLGDGVHTAEAECASVNVIDSFEKASIFGVSIFPFSGLRTRR